ncbi:hypothetical protein NC652_028086 [Populus alba x Populus x berolinensis]|nr:hypothetical protein NC652_028086 [Populus alba x Populus x berolinensis]
MGLGSLRNGLNVVAISIFVRGSGFLVEVWRVGELQENSRRRVARKLKNGRKKEQKMLVMKYFR